MSAAKKKKRVNPYPSKDAVLFKKIIFFVFADFDAFCHKLFVSIIDFETSQCKTAGFCKRNQYAHLAYLQSKWMSRSSLNSINYSDKLCCLYSFNNYILTDTLPRCLHNIVWNCKSVIIPLNILPSILIIVVWITEFWLLSIFLK